MRLLRNIHQFSTFETPIKTEWAAWLGICIVKCALAPRAINTSDLNAVYMCTRDTRIDDDNSVLS